MENGLELADIVDLLASAIVWHSTGDRDAGSKLLACLHDADYELSRLAEYVLTAYGERSLILILAGLEVGLISDDEAAQVFVPYARTR
jgi:hypothetical protein